MIEALKPCPFCGERVVMDLRPDDAESSTYFAAVACYCGGYSACAHKMATAPTADEAEAKVRAAWNERAAIDAALAQADAPADEIERIREHLGCIGRDVHTDPVEVIKMIQGWEADAQARAELLEKHLRLVLEVAKTWQPDYATKMDRDTLQFAEDCADSREPEQARAASAPAAPKDPT